MLGVSSATAQNIKIIDSLVIVAKTAKEDTSKAKLYMSLCKEYYQSDYDLSLKYCQQALALSKKLNYSSGQADAAKMMGNITSDVGKFEEALKYYETSFELYTELKDSSNLGYVLNNIAITQSDMGNYTEAIKIYLKGLVIAEKINDKRVLGKLYNNMGLVYYYQKDYKNALEKFKKSFSFRHEIKDLEGLATNYNNFGIVYEAKNQLDSALFNYYKAYEMAEQDKNLAKKAAYLDNIGNVYQKKGQLDLAIQFNSKALKIREQIGDKIGIAVSSINVGANLIIQKNYKDAEKLFLRAIDICKEIGAKNTEKEAYNSISELYFASKDFEKAYHFYKKFTDLKDSILNQSTAKQVAEMETRYDNEKKQREIEVLTEKNKVQELSANRQNIITWSITACSLLIILFAILMWNRFIVTKKQKRTIEAQKIIVDEKQKETLDSINYASRIQKSLLPTEKYIDKSLNRLKK
ncbi:MAG: hypothetical protein A3K10_03690 [Bacteroidetes bacterium RIFCSPLOWO2_12_FULL_31_6]|nr:MAG: hypothetical protein A3K10_03690 [Bacteroidetes bacterium RIFCSPLOWO2_12_FULL_31_6]